MEENAFLKETVRNKLRSCQKIQVSILIEIERICRKYELRYWLDGGTLLGAVRHNGFIPWDDDIDIAMPSEDYKKFLEVASTELSDNLIVQTERKKNGSSFGVTKIRKIDSLCITKGDHFLSDYNKGIFIDIFEFINYPALNKKFINTISYWHVQGNAFFVTYHRPCAYLVFKTIFHSLRYGFAKVIWSLVKKYNNTRYMMNVPECNYYGKVHQVNSIFPLSQISFEGNVFCAPRSPDDYLKDLYNNYMTIPPLEKRISHAVYIDF